MSIEDRRKKLKEIKAKTTYKKCGKKGHWAGDAECQPKVSNHSVQGIDAIAQRAFSIMDDDSDCDAYMAVVAPKAKVKAKAKAQPSTPGVASSAPPPSNVRVNVNKVG